MEKQRIIRYAVYVAVGLLLAVAVAGMRGLFKAPAPDADGNVTERTTADVMTILSDSFLVPGVLFAGIGGLSWAASKEAYDGLAYGMRTFFRSLIPGKTREHVSYYDYKKEKAENRKPWDAVSLIVGAGFLVLSLIFTFLYFIN